MLAEAIVRSIRAALVVSQAPDAQTAARVLDVVLEEVTVSVAPPTPQQILDGPAEKTPEQRQIEDLQEALMATRERADKAEQKYVELKRNGG